MGHCCSTKTKSQAKYLEKSNPEQMPSIPDENKPEEDAQISLNYSRDAKELQEIIMSTFQQKNKNSLKSSHNVTEKFIQNHSEQILETDYHPLKTSLHSENINRFYDHFFIINQSETTGEGFKQTLSYTSKISESELLLKREEFWETRIEGNQMSWQAIRSACEEEDQFTGEAILQAAGLTLVKNSIQLSYDETGQRFCIPIFCINMPTNYENKKKPTLIEDFEESEIIVNLRDRKKINHKIKISNFCTIEELKLEFQSKLIKQNQEVEIEQICLFYGGKLLENKYKIGEYKIKNDYVIQAHIKTLI